MDASSVSLEAQAAIERLRKDSLAEPVILTDYGQAKSEISRIVHHYNNERRHSSLHYFTLARYHKGEPDVLLAVRESKIEKAKQLRRERNMKEKEVNWRGRLIIIFAICPEL